MFTGLIEQVGSVAQVEDIPSGRRLHVNAAMASELVLGDSVAVNGVCLTVTNRNDSSFQAEISPETTRVTTLGALGTGSKVNLERPLRADMRFGGHFVLGHVDGIGRVREIARQSEFYLIGVTYEPSLELYVVQKGSVAVDGISLTVAASRPGEFDVQIVPYTWEHTNLHAAQLTAAVNLECDIIGKYVVKAVRDPAEIP